MPDECNLIWHKCLSLIEPSISPNGFKTWFKPIEPVGFDGKSLTVQIPSQFFQDFIDEHYRSLINKALLQTVGDKATLSYKIAKNGNGSASLKNQPSSDKPNNLIPRYSFDNFVEGNNNQFARAASQAVAESPGETSFNPLVIYGGVGLGKTHLIQAIANFLLQETNSRRVVYVESEKFTIEFINSIQTNKTTEFSSVYRNADLLIVDDIQFFTNKERTQEEFFHTFNALYNCGKQIVLSSDRPPKELDGVEERLISRFQWGLVVDIQPPDFETRIAILQQKADENKIIVDHDIIQFIARNVTSNIRELEGALIRLLAYSSLKGTDITLELAKDVLKNLSLKKKKTLMVEEIQHLVCAHYDVADDMLRAKTRKKEIVYVRQIAMYLTKKFTNNSLKTIGLHFGGRDHSTVIHAIQNVEDLIDNDTNARDEIEDLKKKIEHSTL